MANSYQKIIDAACEKMKMAIDLENSYTSRTMTCACGGGAAAQAVRRAVPRAHYLTLLSTAHTLRSR